MSKSTSRLGKKRKEDIGLSPYALVFRGQKKENTPRITIFDFNGEIVTEKALSLSDNIAEYKNNNHTTWFNIDGLDNIPLMEKIAKEFNIDNSVMSDIMNPSLRPTAREFEDGLFVTLKIMAHNPDSDVLVSVENLSLIISNDILISFQEKVGDVFDPVRERLRKHKKKIVTAGADYLAFALLDIVIDNYIYVAGIIGDKIENIEEAMSQNPRQELLEPLNSYKQELNILRKHIKPAKEIILNLAKMESEFIQKKNKSNYKELQDNINEAAELVESYREISYDVINMYHTATSTRLNDIMKVLTIISVIFIPLTFIVGVFGTNFDNLPTIHWHYGYLFMSITMIVISLLMIWYFKRKKWF